MFVKLHQKVQRYVKWLEQFADRPWYPFLISFLSVLDNFLIVIPNDGILVASSMLIPKRWLLFAIFVTVGSTIGSVLFTALVEMQGLPWILEYYPGIMETGFWKWTEKFFIEYDILIVFVVAILPITQHPVLILAGLANTPLFTLMVIIFFGRLFKFLLMAYLGSHSPKLLKRIWGMKDELKDAGMNIE